MVERFTGVRRVIDKGGIKPGGAGGTMAEDNRQGQMRRRRKSVNKLRAVGKELRS